MFFSTINQISWWKLLFKGEERKAMQCTLDFNSHSDASWQLSLFSSQPIRYQRFVTAPGVQLQCMSWPFTSGYDTEGCTLCPKLTLRRQDVQYYLNNARLTFYESFLVKIQKQNPQRFFTLSDIGWELLTVKMRKVWPENHNNELKDNSLEWV